MKNRKRTIIILILTILILVMMSGCSIMYVWMYDDWVERVVGSNSICWEDNDNVIVYCSLTWCYNEAIGVSETTKIYEIGGELWRINANTGATELLLRKKGGKYWAGGDASDARIDIVNNHIYISDGVYTFKVKDDYSSWDNIGDFTLQIVSSDERYIVAIDENGDKLVKKYDMINNTDEILFTNDELIEWLDYDYFRNYLLVNNNKFVNLNTGEEKVIAQNGSIIDSIYRLNSINNGTIEEYYISIDTRIYDKVADTLSTYTQQVRINILDPTKREINFGIRGVLSPNKTKYATLSLFTDTLGNAISTWSLPSDEL